MIDPKALEELDLASRAIERARALLARDDPKAMEAALRELVEWYDAPADGMKGSEIKRRWDNARALVVGEGNSVAAGPAPLLSSAALREIISQCHNLPHTATAARIATLAGELLAASSPPSPAVRDGDYGKCVICGEPMPKGEETFKFHGYSGDCPKPPLSRDAVRDVTLREALEQCAAEWKSPPCTVSEGAIYLYQEFARRAEIARAALSPLSPPEGGKP